MKARLLFLLKMTAYWLISFAIAKVLFLVVNMGATAQLSFGDILLVFWHSLRMDLAATAYFMLLPMLVLLGSEWTSHRPFFRRFLLIYTLLLQAVTAWFSLFDVFLYGYWGFRLDIAPVMMYAQTPQESLSFARWWEVVSLLAFLIFWLVMAGRGSRWFLNALPQQPKRWFSFFWLLMAGLWVIALRGGLQQIPLSPGDGYFSDKPYANHATVNTIWNLGYTYTKWGKTERQYRFFDPAQAKGMVQSLHPKNPDSTGFQLINTNGKTNVLILVIESFTAGVIPSLGGENIAQRFEQLRHKGILFSNFYSNGDRSEEGLVSVLSGYPPLPMLSAAAFPDRNHRLPSLIKDFKERGYYTQFYTGAESAFANTGAYIRSQTIDKLTEQRDFPADWRTTKWGVHDHLVFRHLLQELEQPQPPFFRIYATLSSHEPFDVPPPVRFEGSSEVDMFRNAIAYTDHAIADFIEALEQKESWKNLWIIIVADHGHRLPKHHAAYSPQRFHIPMLWLGGALAKRDTVIADFAAQADIPALVAQQLGWGDTGDKYPFSKALHQANPSYSFYTYNHGFGFLTPLGLSVYDHNARRSDVVGTALPKADSLGKAYLQVLEADYEGWLR